MSWFVLQPSIDLSIFGNVFKFIVGFQKDSAVGSQFKFVVDNLVDWEQTSANAIEYW